MTIGPELRQALAKSARAYNSSLDQLAASKDSAANHPSRLYAATCAAYLTSLLLQAPRHTFRFGAWVYHLDSQGRLSRRKREGAR